MYLILKLRYVSATFQLLKHEFSVRRRTKSYRQNVKTVTNTQQIIQTRS